MVYDPEGPVLAASNGLTGASNPLLEAPTGAPLPAASPASMADSQGREALSPAAFPVASRSGQHIVAVGGGKGGIGKSLLTSSLGISLARRGQKVVLIDADLGGANLHTALGVSTPAVTLTDFIHHRVRCMEDVIIDTGIPNLGLVSGAHDFLTAANLKYFQKTRLLNWIRKLEADFIILDIGAGISFNIVDFFLLAEVGILVAVPEPSSIEGAYRFLKMSFYRHLWSGLRNNQVARAIIEQAMDQKNQHGIKTPFDLLETVERIDEEAGKRLKERALSFRPRLVVNQIRYPEDQRLGPAMASVCRKHLGVDIDCLGFIHYDDGIWQSNRRKRPFMVVRPDSGAAKAVDRTATRLFSLFKRH